MSLIARTPALGKRAAARFSTSAARRSGGHHEVYEVSGRLTVECTYLLTIGQCSTFLLITPTRQPSASRLLATLVSALVFLSSRRGGNCMSMRLLLVLYSSQAHTSFIA
jgi:hypothetical protein